MRPLMRMDCMNGASPGFFDRGSRFNRIAESVRIFSIMRRTDSEQIWRQN